MLPFNYNFKKWLERQPLPSEDGTKSIVDRLFFGLSAQK